MKGYFFSYCQVSKIENLQSDAEKECIYGQQVFFLPFYCLASVLRAYLFIVTAHPLLWSVGGHREVVRDPRSLGKDPTPITNPPQPMANLIGQSDRSVRSYRPSCTISPNDLWRKTCCSASHDVIMVST